MVIKGNVMVRFLLGPHPVVEGCIGLIAVIAFLWIWRLRYR
jgi:hypothetical protein